MKRIICSLVILMTAVICVNAHVCGSTGCYSNAYRGGYSHDRTCRVVGGREYCDSYDGIYFQISPGLAIKPDMGFVGSFGFGRKYPSGMTFGIRLNGAYTSRPAVSVGLATTYEFTSLRKYTDIFYPVIGFEGGFGGMKVDEANHWDALPYLGYKAGFRFAAVRGRFDIGFEYSGNYHFAFAPLAKNSSTFLDHSVSMALCVYVP